MIDKRKNNVEPELTKEELERQDALMAARLLKSNLKGPVTRGGNKKPSTRKKVQKEGKKKRKPTTNNPFNQEMYLSQEVQNLLGVDSLSRPKLVKQIWAYIKDNNLQNPQDGRQIICDDKLYKVFKKSMLRQRDLFFFFFEEQLLTEQENVGIFEMNKLISSHLYKKDEMSDGKGGKKPAVKTEMDEVESKADDDDDDAESDGVSDFD